MIDVPRHLELAPAFRQRLGEDGHGRVGDPARLANVLQLGRRFHQLEVVDQVRRLGDEGAAEDLA